jgi:serine protease Do
LLRQGKELSKSVKLGRLEDGEKLASLNLKSESPAKLNSQNEVQKALGMEFLGLSAELRQKYSIKPSVTNGVVISNIDPQSPAFEKHLHPGEVIVEINQEAVKDPADVAKRLADIKSSGKKSALLLIANEQGEVRFVALNIP